MISDIWPIIYSEDLLVLNKYKQIAVVTGWFEKEYVKDRIADLSNINSIGNSYSKILCLNPIIANLSMNRYIRYLICIIDNDKEYSADTFDEFFNGNRSESYDEMKEQVILVKNQITFIKSTLENINNAIENITLAHPYEFLIEDIKEILIPKSSLIWDSNESGYICRSNNIADLFSQMVTKIMTRGKESFRGKTKLREIHNMLYIYNGPVVDSNDDIGLDKKRLAEYYKEFTSCEVERGIAYNYPSRILIDHIEDELIKDKFSKRAYSPIYYTTDAGSTEPPCAVGIHFMITDNDNLVCSVTFRSNDCYRAGIYNILAFRSLQQSLSIKLNLKLGATTVIAHSAHIYSENWGDCLEFIKKYKPPVNNYNDKEGYFIFEKDKQAIILASYFSRSGQIQWMKEFKPEDYLKNIYEISRKLTDTTHSAFVSHEITCLAKDIYTEDSKNEILTLEKC